MHDANTSEFHDREWWAQESRRLGTDWQGIGELALNVLSNLVYFREDEKYWGEPWCEAAREYHANRGGDRKDCPTSLSDERGWAAFDRRMRRAQREDDRASMDCIYERIMRRQPTSQVTVDAIIYAISRRCLKALDEPRIRVRLDLCDAAARAQINRHIEKLFPEASS